MKILLTGGAGYVGSACLRWLLRHGHDPVAFDNLSEGNAEAVPGSRLVVGDIEDRTALEAAIVQHGAEAIMHFAAVASVPDSIKDPELYWRTNVLGTKNVLDAMLNTNVHRLVFSSTAAVYRFDAPMPLTEVSETKPQVPYGTTKLAAENLVREYCRAYGLGAVIFRYFNAAGADTDGAFGEARRHESHVIPLILSVPLGVRRQVSVFGGDWETRDRTCVRDYVHTDDLADAHLLAIGAIDRGIATVYNIGNGTGHTVLEVIKACEEAVGQCIPYEIVERRSGDPGVLVASPQKLMKDLGWSPRHPTIEDIVKTAWRWHSTHANGDFSVTDKNVIELRQP